jgi:hypothetical protein
MTPESLSQTLSEFLEGARAAVVVETGAIAFDLAEAKYSISGEYHKCLLHLSSNELNFERRVLDARSKSDDSAVADAADGAKPADGDWTFAAIVTSGRPQRAGRLGLLTRQGCGARRNAIFMNGRWCGSPAALICDDYALPGDRDRLGATGN